MTLGCFSFLVSDILPTIGDLLENGIDTCIASLQRSSSSDGGRELLYGSRSGAHAGLGSRWPGLLTGDG